jgi:hypothetical protein
MGTPDMQGTFGTFTFYTDDPAESSREVSGGKIVRVAVNGSSVVLPIEGPVNSLRKDRGAPAHRRESDRDAGLHGATGRQPIHPAAGRWSD